MNVKRVTYEIGIVDIINSLRQADHSSRGIVPSVVFLECDLEAGIMRRLWPTRGCCAREERGGNDFFRK